jgi:Tfp pilus assembly protein PilF
MRTRHLLSIFLFLSLGVALFAQGTKGGGGTSSGTATNGTTNQNDLGKKPDWQHLQGRTGDYLSGKVIVKDGPKDLALLWDPIPVLVTCDGKVRFTTIADAKGEFTIASPKHPMDSAPSKPEHPILATDFAGCTVTANLPGYDSSTLKIVNHNILDSPDIGTVELKAEEQGAALAANSASVPKDAMKAFEKSRAEWLDNKPDRAQRDLEKAVQISPQFAEAWYQLGKLQEASNPQGASNSFSKAAAADPQFAQAYDHLAGLAALGGKWKELVEYSDRALELNPRGTPQTLYYSALGNFNTQKKDVAEANAMKALAMDPQHTQPNIEQLIAVILADKGDYLGALQHLRSCLTYLPSGPNTEIVKKQIAQLEQVVPASH